jgi:long-chain acyl-CoA synthetase
MGRIGLIGENSIEYVDRLLDIWNDGECAVLLDWRIPHKTAINMMQEAAVQKCYIEKSLLEKIPEEKQSIIKFMNYEKNSNSAQVLPDDIYDKFEINYSENEAVVIYSSGTTGKAKGIILSHRAINSNADAIINYIKPTKDDCIYIAKTLSHSSTLTGELLVALKTYTRLVIAPTIVPPRFTLNNIKKYAATIICLNPILLSIYTDEYRTGQFCDIEPLKTIYVSGSILDDKIYQRANEAFEGIAIYNVYGLSEAGPRVTAQMENYRKGNSVGKPIKGVEIKIVDKNGDEVKQSERGIIHVNTPSRYNGYVSENDKLSSLYKNWINTGDIGYIDEVGELHIVSRADDVIILDSHKVYPSEVEEKIQEITGTDECAVSTICQNQREILVCLYAANTTVTAEAIKQLKDCLLPYEIPQQFIKMDAIPKNHNGKRSYSDIKSFCNNLRKV